MLTSSATTHSPSNGFSQKGPRPKKRNGNDLALLQNSLFIWSDTFQWTEAPTAARRREISDILGMQERQTQIWFQNRRAKAKLQDGKHSGRRGSTEVSPDSPPERSAGLEVDLHSIIHEDEAVTIIPCTDLTVGTGDRCLTWFIHSGGYGFKMEIPFNTVTDTEFKNVGPHTGLACFVLSHPPIFYLENISSPLGDGSVVRTWKRCSDWTEGHQASQVLRHTVIGSDEQLAYVLEICTAASYHPARTVSSPMELPPPPLAGLTGAGLSYGADPRMKNSQNNIGQGHRRPSYSAPDLRPPPHSAPSATFPQHNFMRPINQSTGTRFEPAVYNDYTPNVHQDLETSGYSAIPVTQSQAARSYASQPHRISITVPKHCSPSNQKSIACHPKFLNHRRTLPPLHHLNYIISAGNESR
ncbi:hypothetical protein BDZ97DRAFT_1929465 [Flammula alnicola]|nr:hypothetical protein BDZ97DRAFT_1929465 [Flammula alnicola]